MDAEIGYITAFRRPEKVDLNSAGAPSAGGTCLVFAMLMPQGEDPLFLTIRYTWLGLSALFIKTTIHHDFFIYDFIRTP